MGGTNVQKCAVGNAGMKRECMEIYGYMSNEDSAKDDRLGGRLQLEGRWPDQ